MAKTTFDITSLLPSPEVVFSPDGDDIDVIRHKGRNMARHSQGAPLLSCFIIDQSGRILLASRTSPITDEPCLSLLRWRSDRTLNPEKRLQKCFKALIGLDVHIEDIVNISMIYPDDIHLANAVLIHLVRLEAAYEDLTVNRDANIQLVCLSFSQIKEAIIRGDIKDATTIAAAFRIAVGGTR